jgi:integrase
MPAATRAPLATSVAKRTPNFWTNHDLRRTVRTRLSALGVSDTVAELVIAHRQKGVRKIYDLHRYDAEKRAALERWERALLAILEPPAPIVVQLQRSAHSSQISRP